MSKLPPIVSVPFKDGLAETILGPDAVVKLSEYNAAIEIRRRIQDLVREKDKARQSFEQTIKDLDTGIKNVQANCKHQHTTYHPDPSGNNDSHIECCICGKIL